MRNNCQHTSLIISHKRTWSHSPSRVRARETGTVQRRNALTSFCVLISMITHPSQAFAPIFPQQRPITVLSKTRRSPDGNDNKNTHNRATSSLRSKQKFRRRKPSVSAGSKTQRGVAKKIKNFPDVSTRSHENEDRRTHSVVTGSRNKEKQDTSTNSSHAPKSQEEQQSLWKKNTIKASVKETGRDTLSLYLKGMGSHDLLTHEDEIVLGEQIQKLKRWQDVRSQLEIELMRPPTKEEWASSLDISTTRLQKHLSQSQRAKTALMEANLRLVISIARQNTKNRRESASFSSICFQDTCQQGILGLAKACDKFDPTKGFRFSTYANWWIQREIKESLADQGRTLKLPYHVVKVINKIQIAEVTLRKEKGRKPTDEELAKKMDMKVEKLQFYQKSAKDAISIDKEMQSKKGKGSAASGADGDGFTMKDKISDSSTISPSDFAGSQMLKDDVRRLLGTLNPREQAVIRLRFGLVSDGEPKTLQEIARKFDTTEGMIKSLEQRALLKLREPYRNQSLKCYVSDL